MSFQKILKATGFILLVLLAQVSFAQTKTITGKVTDSKDGSGMPGVTVSVKGGTAAVQTRVDGTFSINVPAGAKTLSFSSVGFTPFDASIENRTSVDVTLTSDGAALSEVVVIGYGTAKKKDLTGAISTVTSKDFQKGNITTPEQLIAGKIAGVSIISNGGQPGSGSQILIRGGASLNASNAPLIVIDGVPVENSGIAGGNNPLSFINPNDIESFTVLKDASATAIYGTRASNGIIMITTKKGKSGKLKMNFTSNNSISVIRDKVDVLTADEIRSVVNAKGTTAQKAQLGTSNTDWQSEIYQKAFASDNNISITGGLKGLPYRASIGYLNQEGILKTDHLEKIAVSLVLNPVLLKNHLKLDVNLKGAQQQYRFADQGAIGSAVYFDPTKPVMSGGKRYNGYFEWLNPEAGVDFGKPWNRAGRNPVAMLTDRFDLSDSKRFILNAQVDYKVHFLPDLHVNVNVGADLGRGRGDVFISDSSSIAYADSGYYRQYKQNKDNVVFETYLNYVKDLVKIKSRIDVMAGYAYYNNFTRNYNYATYTAKRTLKAGSQPNDKFSDGEVNLISWFGRFNYTLNNKYLLTATFRRDGSSKFGPLYKWANFPAVSFAWKLKEESFLKSNRTVSDLKLRLGYGETGQQDGIGSFIYQSNYFLSNITAQYPFGVSYYQMYRPSGRNETIRWETTATYNIAVDYGFLDNRITGSLDFYLKKTSDLLQSVPQPAGTNFTAYVTSNVGKMENRGVEFNINAQPVRNRDLTWDVSFNATYNKNKITNLTQIENDPNFLGQPTQNISGTQGFAFLQAVGTPRNTFYLYHQIYDQAGKPIEGLFEDLNRDGIINENDKYKGKQANPNMFYGFSTNANFKKWNAGFVLRASFNNYLYNNIYSNNGRLNQILNAYVLGNASRNYLSTGFTGATEQQPLSDYYIENASFLKMDNFNLGYNFGQIMSKKATLRLNFFVQNIFTITKYTGLDPEIGSGIDNNLYPRPRIYTLGINLDF